MTPVEILKHKIDLKRQYIELTNARHYGGCRFQNREYRYVPPTDELSEMML